MEKGEERGKRIETERGKDERYKNRERKKGESEKEKEPEGRNRKKWSGRRRRRGRFDKLHWDKCTTTGQPAVFIRALRRRDTKRNYRL